jgi:hypothetical protein
MQPMKKHSLLRAIRGVSANSHSVIEGNRVWSCKDTHAFGHTRYQGIAERHDAKFRITWNLALRPVKRKIIALLNMWVVRGNPMKIPIMVG